MDVERVVASRLSGATGVPAYVEMPPGDADPGDLIVVERTGGGGGPLEEVRLDVDCWSTREGGGRRRAAEIADAVAAAVPSLDGEPDVFGPTVANRYRMNDPDTRRPRYVVQVELRVCE